MLKAYIPFTKVGNADFFHMRNICNLEEKMPKIDTLDALEEHEKHEDDYQTNSN